MPGQRRNDESARIEGTGSDRIARSSGQLQRVAVAALAALALLLVMLGEEQSSERELHLIAPSGVRSGELLPLRALLYEDLHAKTGPRLSSEPVSAELRSEDGRVLASGIFRVAQGGLGDHELLLAVPPGQRGAAVVTARARARSSDELLARTRIRIGDDAPRALVQERALRTLQTLTEGPVQPLGAQPAPYPLRVRVAGGACVPEETCRVLVHVGEPAAAIFVEPNATVTPSHASRSPSAPTQGVVALEIVTHGPEAELWLRVHRAGAAIATRSVRLPIALGSGALRVHPQQLPDPGEPQLALLGGEGGCIIDAFHDGLWQRTGSLATCSQRITAPFPPLRAGVHRLQARRDPFSAGTAAVAVVAVHDDPGRALDALAEAAHRSDPQDRLAAALTSSRVRPTPSELPATIGYLAAVLETGIAAQPAAATSQARSEQRRHGRQRWLRAIALGALALSGLSIVLDIGRRGLGAASRASEILRDAGRDAALVRQSQLRARSAVALSMLALLLIFVVLALYVLARTVS